MKVAVYLRDEFTDADRGKLAVVLDGHQSTRLATRDEIKEFFAKHGDSWRATLDLSFAEFIMGDLETLI